MQVVWLWNRHRRCRRLLSAYLDGEVTAPERRMVAEHLSECRACASELEELKMTVVLLRDLPDLPVPRSFTLEREPVPADGGTGLLRAARLATAAAGSLAAAMLVGTMVVGVFIEGTDDSEPASDSPAAMVEAAPAPAAQPMSAAAAPAAPAAAIRAAPAPAAAVEVSPTPVAAAMAAARAETSTETEETAVEEKSPAPSPSATPPPSPTVTPAPVEATPLALATAVVTGDAYGTGQEEEPRSDASWRLPAALSGLLILFAAATCWLTVLIRRRSP